MTNWVVLTIRVDVERLRLTKILLLWLAQEHRIFTQELSLVWIVVASIVINQTRLRVCKLIDVLPLLVGWVGTRRYSGATVRIIIHQLHQGAVLVGDGVGATQMIRMDVSRDRRAGCRFAFCIASLAPRTRDRRGGGTNAMKEVVVYCRVALAVSL